MDPTSKFRNALPYALLPVSPALAALHSTTERGEVWCLRCGSHLLSGNADIQIVQMKKRKRALPLTRLLRKTCRDCGWPNDTLITTRPLSSVSRTSSANIQPHPIKTLVPPPPTATSSVQKYPTPSASTLSPPTQPKQRSKKRAGLQEMLLRNRQKTEPQQSGGQISEGLAAFLSGL